MKAILILCFVCGILNANEEFVRACEKYVTRYSTTDSENQWERKFESELQQAIKDNEDNNIQRFFCAKTLEWASDNKGKFEFFDDAPQTLVIQMCRYVLLADKRKLNFPKSVREEFTQQIMEDLTKFLIDKSKAN